jgi:hypothetical protein
MNNSPLPPKNVSVVKPNLFYGTLLVPQCRKKGELDPQIVILDAYLGFA